MCVFDVKAELLNEQIYNLLVPSVFNPTPQKLLLRAQEYFAADNIHAYAFLQDGEYVGIIIFEIKDNIATINDFAVNDEYRNKGIGSKLVNCIVDKFNANIIIAETDDDAVGFYQKFGFEIREIESEYDCKRYICKFSSNCT